MTDTREEIAAELGLLTSKTGPLTRSEERRRAFLLRKLGEADVSAGVAEVRDLYAEWLALESPHDHESERR